MLWCGPAWSRSGSQENAENFVHSGNKGRASLELCFLTPRSEPFPSKSCSSQSSRFGAGPHPDPAVCLTSHVLRSWLQSCLGLCPLSPRDPQSICSSSMPGCSETFFPSVGKNPCTLILSWVTSVPFSSHSSLTLLFAMASPAPSPPCTPPAVHPVLACFLGTAHFLPLPTALTHSGSLLPR